MKTLFKSLFFFQVEHYNNLTLKSILTLQLLQNFYSNSTNFLMKIDDDSFLNLPKLLSDLSNQTQIDLSLNETTFDYFIMGFLFKKMQVAYSKSKEEMIEKYSRKWKSPTYMCKGSKSKYSQVKISLNMFTTK